MRGWILAAGLMAAAPVAAQEMGAASQATASQNIDLVRDQSVAALQSQLAAGTRSSVDLTGLYIARIRALDQGGKGLRSIIAISPDALQQAQASDARRKAKRLLSPLDGIPVLIKDNVETRDLPTTAGSLALKDNHTGRDAPVVARLRAAGAIILGKTNLSEWANIRSTKSMSGWSAVGGLVANPHAKDRTACGSSSGSGAAVAASLAPIAVGTETDGSVVCPASMNGIVGLKPTVGLISRTHIVPISHSQDTAGPMAQRVSDAALLLQAMVGTDPADPTTKDADRRRANYSAKLSVDALKGVRLGVLRPEMTRELAETFDAALRVLVAKGAVLIDLEAPQASAELSAAEFLVLQAELKVGLQAYLATTPASVKVRSLADVIAFNKANAAQEMAFFDQEIFLLAETTKGLDDPDYRKALETSRRIARDTLTAMLDGQKVAFVVTPTYGPAWLSDPVHGDNFQGPSASQLPAISGWPHLSVPMGLVKGLPVGLSFMGRAYSEAEMLGAGFAYEQAAKARVTPR